jgi:hypothetical protein
MIFYPPPLTPSQIQSYTPILMGATNNPTVTYTKQIGRYCRQNNGLCYISIDIVTSNVNKVSALTDAIRISLPVISKNNMNQDQKWTVNSSGGGTLGQNPNGCFVLDNTQYLTLTQQGTAVGSTVINITYTLIGLLSNSLNFNINGWYEVGTLI